MTSRARLFGSSSYQNKWNVQMELRMNDDNLYPRNGAYRPQQPTEQKQDDAKEQAQTIKLLPILQELVERFEERIKFYGDVDAISTDYLTDPAEHMHIVYGNKVAKMNLQTELNYVKELIEEHTNQ